MIGTIIIVVVSGQDAGQDADDTMEVDPLHCPSLSDISYPLSPSHSSSTCTSDDTSISSNLSLDFSISDLSDQEEISPLNDTMENESMAVPSPVDSSDVCTSPASINTGYKLVFDNIDKTVKPRHMRIDSQTKSLHYVQAYAVKDRIDYSCEASERNRDSEVNLYDILPSAHDYQKLKNNFAVHVSRVITSHLDFFKEDFKGLSQQHIQHKYSKEMSKKSEIVRVSGSNKLTQY